MIDEESVDTDTTDHLGTYFREIAEHALLTPQEERALSRDIERVEVLAWRRLLERAAVVVNVLEAIQPKLESPARFPKLLAAVNSATAHPSAAATKRLGVAAREAATRIRALDLDRVCIDIAITKLDPDHASDIRKLYRESSTLRDRFIRANLRLVVASARRYDRGGLSLADLIQEGNFGLMHAIARFDHRRGLRFSTYACWWIRHAIGRALADKARTVRIPVHMLEAQQQIEKVRQRLLGEFGRPPTPQELSEESKVPVGKLTQMHQYIMGQPISLDSPLGEDGARTLADAIADPDTEDNTPGDDMDARAMSSRIAHLLEQLPPVERAVLRLRFGFDDDEDKTFRDIGHEHGLSRERIRQIQNSALAKLRRAFELEQGT